MNSQQPYLLPWQNMYNFNMAGSQLLQQQQQAQQQQQLQLGKLGLQLPAQHTIPLSLPASLGFPGLGGMSLAQCSPSQLSMAGSQLYPVMSPQLAMLPHQQLGLQQQVLAGHPAIPGLQKLFMPSVKVREAVPGQADTCRPGPVHAQYTTAHVG